MENISREGKLNRIIIFSNARTIEIEPHFLHRFRQHPHHNSVTDQPSAASQIMAKFLKDGGYKIAERNSAGHGRCCVLCRRVIPGGQPNKGNEEEQESNTNTVNALALESKDVGKILKCDDCEYETTKENNLIRHILYYHYAMCELCGCLHKFSFFSDLDLAKN